MAMIDPSAVWDFAAEVVGAARRDRGRTSATVTRVDADGTTWVTTGDGGEAPAGSVAAGVSVGDTVTLDWDGSSMGISSNVSNPAPSGSTIRRAVDRARRVANAAQKVADAVNQHFFADTNGIHVTEATQEDWDESHTGANVLINSIGQLFRDGLNNLLTLTTESGARALTIWDGLGNTAEHVVATFAGDGIGLAGDAFHLTSTKATSQSGVEHVTSEMAMDSANGSYKVSSYINTDTYLSDQLSDLLGQMRLGLTTGDSTFSDTYESPSISMYATADTSSMTAAADRVSVVADDQMELHANQYSMEGVNGTSNTWSVPAGTVLWSASNGWQMAANVTATLSYPISSCPSGIVLHWQAYANSATQDYDHVYTFIPKQHVVANAGSGMVCQLANGGFGFVGTKYVYVHDGKVVGHSSNTATGTASGITYNNGHWVLTQVISA